MNNKTIEQVFNIFWIFLGAGICMESIHEKLWGASGPGSGFLPFLTGLVIGLIGCIMFVGNRSKEANREDGQKFWADPATRNRVFFLLMGLCAMAFLLPRLGFLLTSILVTVMMIRVIEKKKWTTILAVSLTSCLAIYFLFQFLMQIRLPKGFLGF
jgi:putative tricarboxylic transport membrane protein